MPTGASHQNPQLDLHDYVRVLRQRKWVILASVVAFAAVAVGLSVLQKPMYSASSKILIQHQQTASAFDSNSAARLNSDLVSEIEIQFFNGQAVRSLAHERLGYTAAASATAIGRGSVMQVTANDRDPHRAAEIANAYAQAYIDARRDATVQEFVSTSQAVQGKVDELDRELEDLDSQIAALSSGGVRPPTTGQSGDVESLRAQREALLVQKETLNKSLDQVQVGGELAKGGGPKILSDASPPSRPYRPDPQRNAAAGLLLGLFVGVAAAFLIDYLDDRIRGRGDLGPAIGTLPVLAVVPSVPGWKDRGKVHLASVEHPSSPAAEAYRTLRTSVQFASLERPIRVLQLTSPRAQDGKSTTSANLAIAASRAGQRVILVDCDLRRPRIHEFFGLGGDVGFTSVLVGANTLVEAARPIPGFERLRVLPAGPVPPDPSELLASDRTTNLLSTLRDAADLVIVDSPPLLPVSDALVLSDRADAVVLVVAAGLTTRREANRGMELLRQVGAPVIGAVLNGARQEREYAKSYSYYHEYPPRQDAEGESTAGSSRSSRRLDELDESDQFRAPNLT